MVLVIYLFIKKKKTSNKKISKKVCPVCPSFLKKLKKKKVR